VVVLKPTAKFVADCPALDFLNSKGRPERGERDWLSNGERWLAWLEQARLVPREVLERFRSQTEVVALDGLAARARELREWLRSLVNRHRGQALPAIDPAELGLLNEILRADEQYYQVTASVPGDSPLLLQPMRLWRTADSLLQPVAAAIARLLCEVDFAHIKACGRCSLLFCDHTRRQGRKWCSMSTCGNRTKQAAHRRRKNLRRSRRNRPGPS